MLVKVTIGGITTEVPENEVDTYIRAGWKKVEDVKPESETPTPAENVQPESEPAPEPEPEKKSKKK